MTVEAAPFDPAALDVWPVGDVPTRDFATSVAALPQVVASLESEALCGVVTARCQTHDLTLLMLNGAMISATLKSPEVWPLSGASALEALDHRSRPGDPVRVCVRPLARPVVECLRASQDRDPTFRPVDGLEELRTVLREISTGAHHGVVDLSDRKRYGRLLLHHGRFLGSYSAERPHIEPSLSRLTPLVGGGAATLALRRVPAGAPIPLRWPARTEATQSVDEEEGFRRQTTDEARNERIETVLLWLLSNVERERTRAGTGRDAEGKVLQVLAVFANAIAGLASQLASSSWHAMELPRRRVAAAALILDHPLVDELEWRGDDIDGAALARRYRRRARDIASAQAFREGITAILLILTQQAAEVVVEEISDPSVRRRCAETLEAWEQSVVAA
jgi:hypothetical protein